MSSNRKISAVLLYLLLVSLVTSSVLLVSSRSRPVGAATFKGWRNEAGRLHAVVEFPPVTKSNPARNFFVTWFYRVQLDLSYTLPNGTVTNESPWLPVSESPTQFTTVKVELPHNIKNLRFTRAATSIERRWDNISLPFRRPSSTYLFTPPLISAIPASESPPADFPR